MSHPMYGLIGTEANQRFRGSLRGQSAAPNSGKKWWIGRAINDFDGTYQSSQRTQEKRLNQSIPSLRKSDVDISSALAHVQTSRPSVAFDRKDVTISSRDVIRGFATERNGLPLVTQDAGVWDQSTFDIKLGKIQHLTRHQMQLLSNVGTTAASGGSPKSKNDDVFVKMEGLRSNLFSPRHLQHSLNAHITALDQIDTAAVEARRCVVEMRQRIEDLAKMHQIALSANIALRSDNSLADRPAEGTTRTRQVDILAQPQRVQEQYAAMDPAPRPHVPRLDDIPLRASPLKSNRTKSVRCDPMRLHGCLSLLALWDGVPQLHACFVAVADGDYSHLLTVQQLKKEDIRTKCVSLNSFTAFLRHCKAYTKLRFGQKVPGQAFELALHSSGCAFDEHRVNFYGFCQVVFNVACFIGVLQRDDGAHSAAGCSSAACAAVTRLLLQLVPQFAAPGSRTARNYERNAWSLSQPFSSRIASDAPAAAEPASCDVDDDHCSRPITPDVIDEHQEDRFSTTWQGRASAEADTEETTGEGLHGDTPERFRLRISCRELLDCDIFSKSDPYAIVSRGTLGGRRQDMVELGRTEIVQDNLNPVFKTCIEVAHRLGHDEELLVQVYDKDDGDTDDFLGEATVLLRDLLVAPQRTQTLPLVVPGKTISSTVTLTAEL